MTHGDPLPRLLVVTDRRTARTNIADVIADAVAGAPRAALMVQLRAKELDARALAELARHLLTILRPQGCSLVINDRVDVALATGADGVHLPEAGLPVAVARELMGPTALVGVSTHSARAAVAAADAGSSYVVCGPVWDTPSKRGLGSPIGLGELSRAAREARCPVFAIGGIENTARATEAMNAGASGVAVIRAVMAHEAPGAQAAAMCRALAPS